MSLKVNWVSPEIYLARVEADEVIGRLDISRADLENIVNIIYKALFTQAVFDAVPEIKAVPPEMIARLLNDFSKTVPNAINGKYMTYAKGVVEVIFGISLLEPAEAEKFGYSNNTVGRVTVN